MKAQCARHRNTAWDVRGSVTCAVEAQIGERLSAVMYRCDLFLA